MKNIVTKSLFMLALAFLLSDCKPSEKVPSTEKEVSVPCREFTSDNKFFRANNVGESMNQSVSKKIAMTNARNDLASAISTQVKTVTDNYINSRNFNNREELEAKYQTLNNEVVNQTLSGIRTVCEKLVQTKSGTYKTYIAIELSASDLVSRYNETISKDEKLRIDYDYEKFREIFEKEMQKRGGN